MFSKRRSNDSLDAGLYFKARKRLKTVERHEMLGWIDHAGSLLVQHLGRYRRDRDVIDLREMREAAVSILAMIDEIEDRYHSR